LAHLKKQRAAVHALRGEARVDYMAENGQRLKVTLEMLVADGGRMRLEALAPIGGGTLAALTSDGQRFQLLDVRANRFFEGPAKACNVGRLLRVVLPPEEVVAVLSGSAPLDGEPTGAGWDPADGGREVLTLRAPDGGTQKIWLDAREKRWDMLAAERYDTAGKILWRVDHEDFSAKPGGVRLPARTTVAEPPYHADAKLKFRDIEVNPTLKEGVFHLQPPAGVPVEPADCQ
jgi:hypothetical protein